MANAKLEKNELVLLKPTIFRNGILVKKTKNDINSCELRKISLSVRDQGYIASINKSGIVIPTGLSWRGKVANPPIDMQQIRELVSANMKKIQKIITS